VQTLNFSENFDEHLAYVFTCMAALQMPEGNEAAPELEMALGVPNEVVSRHCHVRLEILS
jgi:hypothetical protein